MMEVERERIYALLHNETELLKNVDNRDLREDCWVVIDALLDSLVEIQHLEAA